MNTDSAEFVYELVNSGMSREEAIELLKVMASPKHAQKYQGCIDGGITSGR